MTNEVSEQQKRKARARMVSMAGDTTRRGYGARHQALRRQLLPRAIGTPCSRCDKPMLAGQALDLDHTDDRTGYRGFSHAECNRRAAGYKSTGSAPSNPAPRAVTAW